MIRRMPAVLLILGSLGSVAMASSARVQPVAPPADRDDAVFRCSFPTNTFEEECHAYGRLDFNGFKGASWVGTHDDHLRVACGGADPDTDERVIYSDGLKYRYSRDVSDNEILVGADFAAAGAAVPLIHVEDWDRRTGRGVFNASLTFETEENPEQRIGSCEFIHPHSVRTGAGGGNSAPLRR